MVLLYIFLQYVSVDGFDKIRSFINVTLAVSLHFIKLTLIYGTGDYEVIHTCGSSEVRHLGCMCIFVRYIIYYRIHCTLLVIVLSTLFHSCGNSEVMHSSCMPIIIRYTFRYWTLPVIVGSTILWTVVGMVMRYCIQHKHYYFINYAFR